MPDIAKNPLNTEQKRAVEAPFAPLLIVAGAGTGKTKTLTSRIIRLIESGTHGSSVCAITFTNKAAREMERRVMSGLTSAPWAARGLSGPFIGTFHSFGAGILRKECDYFGRNPRYAIFDDNDSFDVIKKAWKELEISTAVGGPAFFRERISHVKNGVVSLDELMASKSARDMRAAQLFELYEKRLEEQNAFDFDDLIEKTVRLFRENPDILQKYQTKLEHLLVDEYQDLNQVQYELVRLLAQRSRSISVVGDWAQTIYTWRGSDVGIFLNFENDWEGACVIALDQNYRSTKHILAAASGVLAGNTLRQPNRLWTENPDGSPVRIVETADEADEANWIAEQIAGARGAGTGASPRKETAAVLYRTNAQSRAIEQALIEHGIPYRIFGGIQFYERREIKDIVAALRYAANERDAVSRDRILKNFPKKISGPLLAEFEGAHARPPLELVERFLKITDYLAYLERTSLNPRERQENIRELLHFASGFDELTPFLEQVSLLQATDINKRNRKTEMRNEGEAEDEVHLMTVHLAKGLEFDRVFVAGVSEGLIPHGRSMDSLSELEEERRLLYVAMTRAKQELALTYYGEPSRFLGGISEEHISFEPLKEDGALSSSAGEHDEERYITLD